MGPKEEEVKTPVDGKDSPAGADDSDEELDQNLLNAIISSGMPSPKKTIASKPVPPKPVTQIPNARQCSQKVLNQVRIHEDSIRKYETEGTPVNISHAGSTGNLSDLSFPGEKSPKTPSRMGKMKPGSIPSSDNSSICDDSDGILAQCIQSAMPKSKSQGKPVPMKHPSVERVRVGPSSHPRPGTRTSASPQQQPVNRQAPPAAIPPPVPALDSVRTYATEGTPANFSASTSLSDLSIQDHPLDVQPHRNNQYRR
ncbi:unnamed protein product [Darwinula stevensoni]|uniref:Uncharacterized protein n=1 Tax=Darwinula stevensoni TaxID=69355 RepID=A0A7R9FRZ2_9CRUS|nr:unnamed protein product [Darwinula stevensoni]CAG0902402.1 unnamed protein product [Darwinula stevensoni]